MEISRFGRSSDHPRRITPPTEAVWARLWRAIRRRSAPAAAVIATCCRPAIDDDLPEHPYQHV